MSSALSALA